MGQFLWGFHAQLIEQQLRSGQLAVTPVAHQTQIAHDASTELVAVWRLYPQHLQLAQLGVVLAEGFWEQAAHVRAGADHDAFGLQPLSDREDGPRDDFLDVLTHLKHHALCGQPNTEFFNGAAGFDAQLVRAVQGPL